MDESSSSSRAGVTVAVAALVGVVLALAALLDLGPCADDDVVTLEEFIAQGDEICARAHDEFLEIQDQAPRTPTDAAEQTSAVIEVAQEEFDAISDLNEPESVSEQVERYLAARQRGIDVLEDGLAAAEDADADAYASLQAELASTQVDPRFEIAREIGFQDCSKPLLDRDELARQAETPAPSDPNAPPTVNNPPTGTP